MSLFRSALLETFTRSAIPLGSNLLLIGPPGAGKTVFCETLMCEAAKNGVKTIYVTLDSAPSDIRKRNNQLGADPAFNNKCPVFVDGYSWLVGDAVEPYRVGNLSNLSDLSVKLISASSELGGGAFFVFDSISTMLIYNPENEVERFLEVNIARMKHINDVGIWVVEQGIHSDGFYNVLRHMADGTLEMNCRDDGELKRFIRMHSFKRIAHSTEWRPFTISGEGLIAIG